MGIVNLRQFLKKKCGAFERTVPLTFFSNKTISIDANMYMCVYKAVCNNENQFKEAFINLFLSLVEAKINVIIVFDGKAPVEKNEEKQRRITKKETSETRITESVIAIEEYEKSGTVSPLLVQIHKRVTSGAVVETIEPQDLEKIKQHVEKQRKHIFRITNEDFQIVKHLANIFGFAVISAPGEAEILCAHLIKNNLADAVLTKDTDVLACCVPIMITEINVLAKKATIITIDYILSSLKLSEDQMLDFCILCGTDYNSNINKIGPVNALKLIHKHGNLETIEKTETKLDTSVLKYLVTRRLFTEVDIQAVSIPNMSPVNYEKLNEYMYENKLKILNVFDSIKELCIGKLYKLNNGPTN
jgi:flap endonuclease-1